MKERVGNIWTYHSEKQWIIITTNIGWKKDGLNPMGAGIAAKASELFPELPKWYGDRCKKFRGDTAVCAYVPANFLLFPTKPLAEKPWLSWQQDSDCELIKRSARQLQALVTILRERGTLFGDVYLPLVGCENGNLTKNVVLPILSKYLDDRFVLLERLDY